MKLRKVLQVVPKPIQIEANRDDVREAFLEMDPLDLSIGVVAPLTFRPYLSLVAKEHGLKYVSFKHPKKPKMAVFIVLKS